MHKECKDFYSNKQNKQIKKKYTSTISYQPLHRVTVTVQ